MFPEQTTLEFFTPFVFYLVATFGIVIANCGIMLLTSSASRAKHSLSQSLHVGLPLIPVVVISFGIAGYAIWMTQFYQAAGVPNAFAAAFKDYGLFNGFVLSRPAWTMGLERAYEAEVFQIFFVFFVVYALIIAQAALKGGFERAKLIPMYIYAAVLVGVVAPIVLYLIWGPAGPLSNRGAHDFFGAFPFHMTAGIWAAVLAWRCKKRVDVVSGKIPINVVIPHNMHMLGVSLFFLFFGLTVIVPGCMWIVPGVGTWGIAGTTSGPALTVINLWASFGGGGLAGLIMGHKMKNPAFFILFPLLGFVANTATLDIATPLISFGLGVAGPFMYLLGVRVMSKIGIDDPMGSPVHFFPALLSAVAAGFIGWGMKQGGWFGGIAGYEWQGATINPGIQFAAIGIVIAFALSTALITALIIDKTIGFRKSDAEQEEGLDKEWILSAYEKTEVV